MVSRMPKKEIKEIKEKKDKKETKKEALDKLVSKETLVIVESPSKCKKIEGFLGPGYHVVATMGHFRDIGGLENIDTKTFEVKKYRMLDNDYKKANLERIKKAIDTCDYDEILLATDDDREGEAIAWHICDTFGLSAQNTKRIVFHEITQPAILTAVANPRRINMDLVEAQKGRQILDMLVGFKVSPLLWKYIVCEEDLRKELSAGRCQTPALHLIYENAAEVAAHPGKHVYHVSGLFTSQNVGFHLSTDLESAEEVRRFLELSKTHAHVFGCGEPRHVLKAAPEPLSTSRIQQLASNELHLSPKDTMKICQKLYEAGLITYMRTDSKKYSGQFLESVSGWLHKNGLEPIKYMRDRGHLTMNNGDSAHEAIRPTCVQKRDLGEEENAFEKRERRLYALIWKTAVQSCMTDAAYMQIKCTLTAPLDLKYETVSEQLTFDGWKQLEYDMEKEKEGGGKCNGKTLYAYLRTLKSGAVLPYKQLRTDFSVVDRKLYYTEAKWVNLLEEKGIGRPSTYSSLIEKVQERRYVVKEDVPGVMVECIDFLLESGDNSVIRETPKKKELGAEKNKMVIQPLGIAVIEFLMRHFSSFFEYGYTKHMEDQLDLIALSSATSETISETISETTSNTKKFDLCNSVHSDLTSLIESVKKEHADIIIDADHIYKVGKYGPYIETIGGRSLPIRKGINPDIDKLRSGGYRVEDLVEVNFPKKFDETCQGKSFVVKKGRYGLYVEWDGQRISLAALGNRPIENVGVEEVIGILESKCVTDSSSSVEKPESKIVRTIDENTSIRKGPYGDYIFYKTKAMKKPLFIKLDKFDGDYKTGNIDLLKRFIGGYIK